MDYSFLRPVVTGMRAARMPGSRPPMTPSMSAYHRPVTSSAMEAVKQAVDRARLQAMIDQPLIAGELYAALDSRDYAARSAVVTGSRAARIAGNSPPTKPINNAMTAP